MKQIYLCLLLLFETVTICVAYNVFQGNIPNGHRVPHPCKVNHLWRGLGHKNSEGGGPRNPFGEDFDKNDRIWNKCLCERDSDGDGKTNGEELGDPNCVWKEGELPEKTDGLTHPGVCEPLNSPKCEGKNDWEFCEATNFDCDAITKENVTEVRLQMPLTKVPAEETTYQCMHFDLPSDQEYHIIADKPIYNNTRVLHHILVFGCDESNDTNSKTLTEPTSCSMGGANCQKILALWSVGVEGNCLPDAYGFRVGLGAYTKVLVQVHWNNPELSDDQYDAPGISVFITPNLRPYDGGVMMMGTSDIEIPARSPHYSIKGSCGSGCTKDLQYNLTIDSVYLHMHYLGYESAFEHTSNGVVNQVIFEENYSYDNPILYRFEEPLKFKPGDSLAITCNFKAISKNKTTYFGEGTDDEMCFAFVNYYPEIPSFQWCFSSKIWTACGDDNYVLSGCDLDEFMNVPGLHTPGIGVYVKLGQLAAACNGTGSGANCSTDCVGALAELKNETNCLDGEVGEFVENQVLLKHFDAAGTEFVRLLHLCDTDDDDDEEEEEEEDDNDDTTSKPTVTPSPEDRSDFCIFEVGQAPTLGCTIHLVLALLAITLWVL